MNQPKSATRREEYAEATRQALLHAGCEAFAADGFAASGIEAISRSARVTRGAFYHHFDDKRALFDAVVVTLQADAARRVEARARTEPALGDRLLAGIDAYFDACLEPAYNRIVVHEAPSVLGRQRCREIEDRSSMALLLATLHALQRRGEIEVDDVDLLGRMLDAMICEAALLLPDAAEPELLRSRCGTMIGALLRAFRRPLFDRGSGVGPSPSAAAPGP